MEHLENASTRYAESIPSGRVIAYQATGDPNGETVLRWGGTPSSRLTFMVDQDQVLSDLGLQLINWDRPGYGESGALTPVELTEWSADSAANDALAILKSLGREKEPLLAVGQSGGAIFAEAFAAKYPEITSQLLILAGFVQLDPKFWGKGSAPSNIRAHAGMDENAVVRDAEWRSANIQADPGWLFEFLKDDFSEDDRQLLFNKTKLTAIGSLILNSYRESVRHGSSGMVADRLAMKRPFDLHIDAQTHFWHGSRDVFSTAKNMRRFVWWMMQDTSVTYEIEPYAGHFRAFAQYPNLLRRWVENRYEEFPFASDTQSSTDRLVEGLEDAIAWAA